MGKNRKQHKQNSKKLSTGQKISVFTLFIIILGIAVGIFLIYDPKTTFVPSASVPATSPVTGFDKALLLDGKTSFLIVGNSGVIQPEPGFTVEAWIKPSANEFSSVIVDKKSDKGDVFRILVTSVKDSSIDAYIVTYEFGALNSSDDCTFHRVFRQRIISNTETDKITSWQHIAGVIQKSGKLDIFINGEVQDLSFNKISGICEADREIYVGAQTDINGQVSNYFIGEIDEVRISTKARYTSNFKAALHPFLNDSDTLVLYHFDTTLNDDSNRDHDASPSGNLSFTDSNILLDTSPPEILTVDLKNARVGIEYSIRIEGKDNDIEDALTMVISNLPPGMVSERCRIFNKNTVDVQTKVRFISCPVSGVPREAGDFTLTISLSDGATTVEKSLKLNVSD